MRPRVVDKELSRTQVRELVLPNGEPKSAPADKLSSDVAKTLEANELRMLGYHRDVTSSDRSECAERDRLGFI